MDYQEIIKELRKQANAKNVAGMARFGITSTNTLGISIYTLRDIAKKINTFKGSTLKGRHSLAIKLWNSKIHEARILASMVDVPELVGAKQMDLWVGDFDSWDVCDQVTSNLFDKTPYAYKKVFEWVKDEREFVRRAAFALIAALAWQDKDAHDKDFKPFFPLIKKYSTDDRNFVKKAVNWALRNIGKKRPGLKKEAIEIAKKLEQTGDWTARWIAKDALRELNNK